MKYYSPPQRFVTKRAKSSKLRAKRAICETERRRREKREPLPDATPNMANNRGSHQVASFLFSVAAILKMVAFLRRFASRLENNKK